MTVTTTEAPQQAATAAMPRINLMPPEIAEGARLRQVQFVAVLVVVLAVVIDVLLYLSAHKKVSTAQDALNQAKVQQTALQEKLDSLASVEQTFAAVQAKQALLTSAMGEEVRWSYVLNDLSLRMPSNVFLTSLTVSETAAPGTAPPAAGTEPISIGSITFGAVGFKHDDVAAWLDALAKQKGFDSPSFGSSSEQATGTRGYVIFSSSVDLLSSLLSLRYVPAASS